MNEVIRVTYVCLIVYVVLQHKAVSVFILSASSLDEIKDNISAFAVY